VDCLRFTKAAALAETPSKRLNSIERLRIGERKYLLARLGRASKERGRLFGPAELAEQGAEAKEQGLDTFVLGASAVFKLQGLSQRKSCEPFSQRVLYGSVQAAEAAAVGNFSTAEYLSSAPCARM
jgi:hypothetical protein